MRRVVIWSWPYDRGCWLPACATVRSDRDNGAVPCSKENVVVEREPQVSPIVQDGRLVLTFALPGAHARHLVGLACAGFDPEELERSQAATCAFAVILHVQLAQPAIDRVREARSIRLT